MGMRVVALDEYQGLAERMELAGRLAAELEAAGLGAELAGLEVTAVREHLDGADLVAALAGAPVVVAMRERTRFDAALLGQLPDLRLLVTTGMRNAAIDLAAAARQGVTVCGTGGPRSANTAELTWGLILSLQRHIPEEDARVRAGGWQLTVGRDLLGTRLGLVGLGRIGRQMAAIGQAFGMDVAAWSQNLDPAAAQAAGVTPLGKEELLRTSDVVSLHLVLSERSRHIVGEPELRAMKPTAILVNSSRGPLVDPAALSRALHEGWIAGAGLDVYETEPMLPGDPRRTLPRTVLTPHLGYVTDRTMDYWYTEIAQNIAAWRAGSPVRVIPPPA
jgi:phosphoglycerate dehydrogenase-like enzyme